MNILITGGAGYLGYATVQALQAPDSPAESLRIFDNLSRKTYAFFGGAFGRKANMDFVQGELLDARKLGQALNGIDTVLHLAAKVSTPFADQEAHALDQVNHWGTAQLVQTLQDHPGVRRFIYVSSASVYGHTEGPVDEATPPHPDSPYGQAKLRGESQLQRLPAQCRAWILRPGNLYGYNPAIRYDAVLNRFLFEAHFSGRITVQGSGAQIRPFLHVDKMAGTLKALLQADLESRAPEPGLYNAVEHNWSVRDLARLIGEQHPDVEVMTVNQHLAMRSLEIATPCRLFEPLPLPKRSVQDELLSFRESFTF